MRERAKAYARKRPVRACLIGLVLVVIAATAFVRVADLGRWWLFTQRLAAFTETAPTGEPRLRAWTVGYGHARYPVEVHIYPSEIEAGRALNTAWVFESPAPVRARYVRSLVIAQSQTRLVSEFAGQMRAIARRAQLDSDGYAELLARSVQDIEYGSVGSEIGLPAEILELGQGVCSEKSVLLGALLLHEGYDTAVLVLDSQDHVAVGLGSDGPRFRDLPYAFVETTSNTAIGEVRPDYLEWGPIGRPPQTIPLGGAKRYRG